VVDDGGDPRPGRPGVQESLRAAELIGALSLATDLGVGEPLEHGLRTTVIGVRLAKSLGLDEEARREVYYVALLRYAGCTAESHLDAALFGDEIAVRAAMAPVLYGSRAELFLAIARTMRAGEPARWRAVAVARAVVNLQDAFRKGTAGHCEMTQVYALRLGLGAKIQAALGDVFERWDGKGFPIGHRGDEVPLPVRIMQVAEDDVATSRAARVIIDRQLTQRDVHAAAGTQLCDDPGEHGLGARAGGGQGGRHGLPTIGHDRPPAGLTRRV